jgi:hypothetical protein
LEFFLQTLADDLGVSGRPNGPREMWNEYIATILGSITMNPYCRNEGKYEYSLPSRPMAVYKKVVRDFPYDLAFPGHNDPRLHTYKNLACLLVNSIDAIRRRDLSPFTPLVSTDNAYTSLLINVRSTDTSLFTIDRCLQSQLTSSVVYLVVTPSGTPTP